MSERLTAAQRKALQIAVEFDRVIQDRGDSRDAFRPDRAPRVTLESLRARGLLSAVDGPRYMPTYEITDKGREALDWEG